MTVEGPGQRGQARPNYLPDDLFDYLLGCRLALRLSRDYLFGCFPQDGRSAEPVDCLSARSAARSRQEPELHEPP